MESFSQATKNQPAISLKRKSQRKRKTSCDTHEPLTRQNHEPKEGPHFYASHFNHHRCLSCPSSSDAREIGLSGKACSSFCHAGKDRGWSKTPCLRACRYGLQVPYDAGR